tara:strand:+ start:3480 stop:3860 length:381 start_codon:yes stop_codon:yes gene_type:complete
MTARKAPSVGYKRPPTHSQFKKGTSGNPKGRPKGAKNLHTIFEREGARTVAVKVGDKTRKAPKQEILIRQIFDRALQGDLASARLALVWLAAGPVANTPPDEPERPLTDAERNAMIILAARLGAKE